MNRLVLFCKSYEKDLNRAKRLADSIDRYNRDGIPFYVSVPECDFPLFEKKMKDNHCLLLKDEEIIDRTCEAYGQVPGYFSSHLTQQLIKLEFWRMGKAQNYAWVDSDSYFIKEFQLSDFMYDEETPYTIRQEYDIEEKKRRWKNVPKNVRDKRIKCGVEQVKKFQRLFEEESKNYDFGVSTPIIWSAKVLRHLEENYLIPNGKSIFRLLSDYPCETFLYGYYLMHSHCIPIHPRPHMFKNYDYADEFIEAEINGENEVSISQKYFGICIQSNWALFSSKKKWTDRLKNRKQELMTFFSKLA